jgi:hypothetical protein
LSCGNQHTRKGPCTLKEISELWFIYQNKAISTATLRAERRENVSTGNKIVSQW